MADVTIASALHCTRMKNELDYFHNRDDEDVSIWLKRWTLKKQAKGWDDATAINEAALHFSEAAFKWFLMHGINNNTWDTFCQLASCATEICG